MTITVAELQALTNVDALFADMPEKGIKDAPSLEMEDLERRAGVWEAQPGYDGSPAPTWEDQLDDEELDWDEDQWEQAREMDAFIDGLFRRQTAA
jgi:hypothetical protein